MNNIFLKRFKELENEMKELETTKTVDYSIGKREFLNHELFLTWKLKVKNLIVKICGEDSLHLNEFTNNEDPIFAGETNYDIFKKLRSIFLATKDDFEGGYLSSVRTLVQADVFDSELEQAEELLKNGYHIAAAVIAGVVLETYLRELCTRESIVPRNLNKMNADLTKAGVFNLLISKQITALADIRNSAAHGKIENFTKSDVRKMISDIKDLLIKIMD